MALLADLVLQTANAPGTSTFNLIAPSAGRRSFISATGAGQTYYYAHDGTNWEIGGGTVTAGSPDTLSRDFVIANLLGTTAKINFVSTVNVWNDVPAARSIYAAADNVTVPFAGRVLTGLGAGVSSTDAAQVSQVGWQRIGADVVPAAGTGVVGFSLDTSKYLKFRMEWVSGVGQAAGAPYVRFSQDGGFNYKSGATDYNYGAIIQSGNTVSGSVGTGSYAPLMGTTPTAVTATTGWLEIDPTNMEMTAHCVGVNAGGVTITSIGFTVALTANATNVIFGFVNTNISAVRVRLLGWGF